VFEFVLLTNDNHILQYFCCNNAVVLIQ